MERLKLHHTKGKTNKKEEVGVRAYREMKRQVVGERGLEMGFIDERRGQVGGWGRVGRFILLTLSECLQSYGKCRFFYF